MEMWRAVANEIAARIFDRLHSRTSGEKIVSWPRSNSIPSRETVTCRTGIGLPFAVISDVEYNTFAALVEATKRPHALSSLFITAVAFCGMRQNKSSFALTYASKLP